MWFYVLTLIVFGHLQIAVKSNPVAAIAVQASEHTPGTGNVQIHHQVTTLDTAEAPHKVGASALVVSIFGEDVPQPKLLLITPEQDPVPTRQRRQSAAAAAAAAAAGGK